MRIAHDLDQRLQALTEVRNGLRNAQRLALDCTRPRHARTSM
jgi:hypothetical protein